MLRVAVMKEMKKMMFVTSASETRVWHGWWETTKQNTQDGSFFGSHLPDPRSQIATLF